MRRLFVAMLMLCLVFALAAPVFAGSYGVMTACNVADPVHGKCTATHALTGEGVLRYDIPDDGAALVICFDPDGYNSRSLFQALEGCDWVDSSHIKIYAIGDYADAMELSMYVAAQAPNAYRSMEIYQGGDVAWTYAERMTSGMFIRTIVALLTEENGVPTIRYYDDTMDGEDVDRIFNSLCQLCPAFAQENPPDIGELSGSFDSLSWSFDVSTGTLTVSGSGPMKELDYGDPYPWAHLNEWVQKLVVKEGVTSLSWNSFAQMESLTQVTLPQSLEAIDTSAFEDCYRLSSVKLPSGLKKIGTRAFENCYDLTAVDLPSGLTELGQSAFRGCPLTSVTLPDSLTFLGYQVFSDAQITTLTIPAGLQTIEDGALEGLSQLASIQVAAGNANYKALNGVLFNMDGTEMILYPAAKTDASYAVPAGVTKLADYAFNENTYLTSVSLPDSVQSIGMYCFNKCTSLKTVTGGAYTELGSYAFSGCESLTSIALSKELKLLDWHIFAGCTSLTHLALPQGIETISAYMADGSGLTQVVIPDSVDTIDYNAFYNMRQLKEVIFLGSAPVAVYLRADHIGSGDTLVLPENAVVYYPENAGGWSSNWAGAKCEPYKLTVSGTASCLSSGTLIYSCREPAFTYSTSVQVPLGHALFGWELVKAATADSEGQWARHCSRCGEMVTITIPKLLGQSSYAASSNNRGDQDYEMYGNPVNSYLVATDGGYTRVEHLSERIVVETYDKSYNFQSRIDLSMELPVFGGFYTDGTYNFLFFGQDNLEQDEEREVFRLVRYSADWQRMDDIRYYGENTWQAITEAAARMAHYGDYLFIRSNHRMNLTPDGKHHQANVFFQIHIPTMTTVDKHVGISNVHTGYVSHSFNQFVIIDGTTVVAADHGDAAPARSAALLRYPNPANVPFLAFSDGELVQKEDTLSYFGSEEYYVGEYDYNYTGASMGGLAASKDGYLIAGNSIVQDHWNSESDTRNIYVSGTSKNFEYPIRIGEYVDNDYTTVYWLTDHAANSGIHVSTPHLVKLSDTRLLVLWTEDGVVCFAFVNAQGKPVTENYTMDGSLSDCVPIVDGNKVVWYVTNGGTPAFYSIDLAQYSVMSNPFTDVKEDRFYDAILWAYTNGITTGTTDTTFSPENPCTRKQIVTFLWRAAGEPEPASMDNPFTDVPHDRFEKAILWAYYKGITTGTGDGTTFSGNETCTRKQIVTFLWRFNGCPEPARYENPFTDVKTDRFCNAILWAYYKGITTGTGDGTTFSGENPCTRKQIVTFLYRDLMG